jgi:hypothetical protein
MQTTTQVSPALGDEHRIREMNHLLVEIGNRQMAVVPFAYYVAKVLEAGYTKTDDNTVEFIHRTLMSLCESGVFCFSLNEKGRKEYRLSNRR